MSPRYPHRPNFHQLRDTTDPDQPRRQQLYLRALGTIPNLTIHYGRFLTKTKSRPLVQPDGSAGQFVMVHDTEEKGSDVNLAAHLINDGWRDRFDVAVVLSQDSDLVEPVRMVRHEIGKTVGLVWLDGRKPSGGLASSASFVRSITPARLRSAQFPQIMVIIKLTYKVLALVDRKAGTARTMVVDDLKATTLTPILTDNIAREACVMTDEVAYYNRLKSEFADHEFVRHKAEE